MKKITSIPVLILFMLLTIWFIPSAIAGPSGVLVYPGVIELNFSKTTRRFVSTIVNVENPSNKPVRVRAYVQGWDMSEYGTILFLKEPNKYSLNDYIKFNPKEFDLAPGQKQVVRITAKLPEGMDGEFRSIIFFETVASKENLISTKKGSKLNLQININTRFGVAIYAYKGNISRNATFDNLTFEKSDEGKQFLEATFTNDGNIHTNVEGNIFLAPVDKPEEEQKLRFARMTILPGRTQKRKLWFTGVNIEPGDYNARIRLTYKDVDDKEHILEAETTFHFEKPENLIKNQLQKPEIIDKIKMTPDNLAKPIPIDETEIKLETE